MRQVKLIPLASAPLDQKFHTEAGEARNAEIAPLWSLFCAPDGNLLKEQCARLESNSSAR